MSREGLRNELWPASDAHIEFQYLDLLRQSAATSTPLHYQGLRKALVAGLKDHLEYVTRNMGQLREKASGTVLPYGMAVALQQAIEEVSDGQLAELFTPKPFSGGRGNRRRPDRQSSIKHAVCYLTAVRLGWLSAEAARVEVAALYGVTVRQVDRWLAAAGKPRQREGQLRGWAAQRGLRPFSEDEAARALKKLLPVMAAKYRVS